MQTDPVAIRNAETSDIAALLELLRELFAIEADFDFNEVPQRRGLFLMIDGCRKHAVVKVAEIDGKIVGMATAQTVISTAEGGPAVLVEDVVVAPDLRNRGIGRQLVDSLCEWAESRGARRLQLLADAENRPAIEFYRRIGWVKTQLVCLRRKN